MTRDCLSIDIIEPLIINIGPRESLHGHIYEPVYKILIAEATRNGNQDTDEESIGRSRCI